MGLTGCPQDGLYLGKDVTPAPPVPGTSEAPWAAPRAQAACPPRHTSVLAHCGTLWGASDAPLAPGGG